LLPFTWVFYIAIMSLQREWDNLPLIAKIFAAPIIVIGVASDFLFNLTWGTILFLELPRWGEWMMTARLKRHIHDHKLDWRDRNGNWFCWTFLNRFDKTGNHCG